MKDLEKLVYSYIEFRMGNPYERFSTRSQFANVFSNENSDTVFEIQYHMKKIWVNLYMYRDIQNMFSFRRYQTDSYILLYIRACVPKTKNISFDLDAAYSGGWQHMTGWYRLFKNQ